MGSEMCIRDSLLLFKTFPPNTHRRPPPPMSTLYTTTSLGPQTQLLPPTPHPLIPFKISVQPDIAPVTSCSYRINPILAKKVDAVLDHYLSAGLIQLSISPYSSPMVVIPKKHGTVRITVNYKRLT